MNEKRGGHTNTKAWFQKDFKDHFAPIQDRFLKGKIDIKDSMKKPTEILSKNTNVFHLEYIYDLEQKNSMSEK